ncbi:MAG: 50S ribosomal protein L25 [Anaerolineae bacterium]|jgi:large subunit ribosomal protein L25
MSAKQIELNAKERTVLGKKVRRLREEGWIPAVLYGASVESRPLQIEETQAEEIVSRAGTSQLIAVHIEGEEEPLRVLVRDLQRDPIHRNLLHLDLYQVDMEQRITVEVPLVLVGESPPVAQQEGVLFQTKETIELECLPVDLIEAIEVDLSQLTDIGHQITVADLAVPATSRILSDPREMVVRVSRVDEGLELEEEEEIEEVFEVEPELVTEREEEEELPERAVEEEEAVE